MSSPPTSAEQLKRQGLPTCKASYPSFGKPQQGTPFPLTSSQNATPLFLNTGPHSTQRSHFVLKIRCDGEPTGHPTEPPGASDQSDWPNGSVLPEDPVHTLCSHSQLPLGQDFSCGGNCASQGWSAMFRDTSDCHNEGLLLASRAEARDALAPTRHTTALHSKERWHPGVRGAAAEKPRASGRSLSVQRSTGRRPHAPSVLPSPSLTALGLPKAGGVIKEDDLPCMKRANFLHG